MFLLYNKEEWKKFMVPIKKRQIDRQMIDKVKEKIIRPANCYNNNNNNIK